MVKRVDTLKLSLQLSAINPRSGRNFEVANLKWITGFAKLRSLLRIIVVTKEDFRHSCVSERIPLSWRKGWGSKRDYTIHQPVRALEILLQILTLAKVADRIRSIEIFNVNSNIVCPPKSGITVSVEYVCKAPLPNLFSTWNALARLLLFIALWPKPSTVHFCIFIIISPNLDGTSN